MLGGTPIRLVVVLLSVLGLWTGARFLVDSVVSMAHRVGVSELTIGLTIVAIGTSMPELVVSLDAALADLGAIAVSTVIGSNSYNFAFILGIVSLLGVVAVERSLVHRDGIAIVLATVLGGLVLVDGTIGRAEGTLLAALFIAYTGYLFADERRAPSFETVYPESKAGQAVADRVSLRGLDGLLFLGGLGLVLVSGHFLVEASTALALSAGVSEWVIGGTVVAAGPSTPELAVSMVAMWEGHVGMSVGNVVGSNVFNLLGILGLPSLLRPLSAGPGAWPSVV